MLIIGATAIPVHRVISVTKGSTETEYHLDVVYEGAGGERLEKVIPYNSLAELDQAFKAAIGDSEAKDMKFYKRIIGDDDSVTYQESMSGSRKVIRIGNDKVLQDVRQVIWRLNNTDDVSKSQAVEEIVNLVGSY